MRLSQDKLSELVEKHTCVADDVSWNRFTSIPWQDLQPELLTAKQRSAIAFVNLIEDHLPGYFTEYMQLFPINTHTPLEACMYNRELYHFLVRWAQEEDRHAHVLTNYQLRAGLMPVEQLQQELAHEGRKQFTIKFTEPLQVFTYALLQEKATLLYYKQLHQVIREPVLKFILRLLMKDEARHFAFFSSIVGAHIEEFGEQAIPLIKVVLQDFKMPLHNTLTNYWRRAMVTCDAVGGHQYAAASKALAKLVHKWADPAARLQAPSMVNTTQKVHAV